MPARRQLLQQDAAIAIATFVLGALVLWRASGERPPDLPGTVLLAASCAPLLWRRRWPVGVLTAHMAAVAGYHALDFQHAAPMGATVVAFYTASVYSGRRRLLALGLASIVFTSASIALTSTPQDDEALETFGVIGWILAVLLVGQAVRWYRAYLAEIVDRAERAERTRDEEVRRQVAEERLRIARDLHDLVAHSVTVVQVQAGVARHLLQEGKADAPALARTLDAITDACADARSEIAATVGLLREPAQGSRAPLPGLAQVSGLLDGLAAAGVAADVLRADEDIELPPLVDVVAYRILQEALTNVVKHSGATHVSVRIDAPSPRNAFLRLEIHDNGHGAGHLVEGFGVLGMRERAAAVGGDVTIRSAPDGFTVTAALPVPTRGAIPADAALAGER